MDFFLIIVVYIYINLWDGGRERHMIHLTFLGLLFIKIEKLQEHDHY